MEYILSFENFIFVDFLAVKGNGSDVKPGICVTVNTHSYRYLYTENISLDFEPNRYSIYILFDENKHKFLNLWLVCILKHCGVMRQIPGLM